MSVVDIDSIMSKVGRFASSSSGKKMMSDAIAGYRKNGIGVTNGGSEIFTRERVEDIATELIMELRATARHLVVGKLMAPSVADHFDSLRADVVDNADGEYTVNISFEDDLSRPSIERTDGGIQGGGIDNIVALFNFGYTASGAVAGVWHTSNGGDVETISLRHRQALGFMESAIQRFNIKYIGRGVEARLMWISTGW